MKSYPKLYDYALVKACHPIPFIHSLIHSFITRMRKTRQVPGCVSPINVQHKLRHKT